MKRSLLCVLCAAALAGLYSFNSAKNSFLKDGKDGKYIERSSKGEGDREYVVSVEGIGESAEEISIVISEREYGSEEINRLFGALADELPLYISGTNENLFNLTEDLELPSSLKGYEGIRLSWYPDDAELISYKGELNNEEIKMPVETGITVVLKYRDKSEEYHYQLRVLPKTFTEEERLFKELKKSIEDKDSDTASFDRVELPSEISGIELSYDRKSDNTPILIFAGGILAAILLYFKPLEDAKKKRKERDERLLLSYADMVSKLLLYIGAGLSVRSAWERSCLDYESSETHTESEKEIYGEMKQTLLDMERGIPEDIAYEEFGSRCGLRCYQRLVALIEQNRKNGDKALRSALKLEMEDAFSERKNNAVRLGHEASTKLMLPLFMSFAAVMLIVMAPAMMSLN